MTSATSDPEPPAPRRIGRPPKIDRDSIARAVIDIGFELGFDQVNTKVVAEHLGVSSAGLYYYVRGRDDLLMLASEYSMVNEKSPEDRGEHWADWLREWARHMRSSMGEYELMEHYIFGLFNIERMMEISARNREVLERHGFDREQALMAWGAVCDVAIGAAVMNLRSRALARATRDGDEGEPREARRVARATNVRALREAAARDSVAERDAAFEERVTILLIGCAVRAGLLVDDHVLGIAALDDDE